MVSIKACKLLKKKKTVNNFRGKKCTCLHTAMSLDAPSTGLSVSLRAEQGGRFAEGQSGGSLGRCAVRAATGGLEANPSIRQGRERQVSRVALCEEFVGALSPVRQHFGWRLIDDVVNYLAFVSKDGSPEQTALDAEAPWRGHSATVEREKVAQPSGHGYVRGPLTVVGRLRAGTEPRHGTLGRWAEEGHNAGAEPHTASAKTKMRMRSNEN